MYTIAVILVQEKEIILYILYRKSSKKLTKTFQWNRKVFLKASIVAICLLIGVHMINDLETCPRMKYVM